jgi:hypothetical protein
MQEDFVERLEFVTTFLNSQAKMDLRWLINRAYFSGYSNGETDKKG